VERQNEREDSETAAIVLYRLFGVYYQIAHDEPE
jgi:hypothetical protein